MENSQELITLIQKSPNKFLSYLEKNKIDQETVFKIFPYASQLLKEVERKAKMIGIKILELIADLITPELLSNAYIFEKDLAKSFTVSGSKLVSVGDYEMKDDDRISSFGFFAAALEEEKKEIKIETLNLISKLGAIESNKEFSIKSFKYIVELINDEEDDVRFATIKSLEILIKNFLYIDVIFF
jgi:hypothetical protein